MGIKHLSPLKCLSLNLTVNRELLGKILKYVGLPEWSKILSSFIIEYKFFSYMQMMKNIFFSIWEWYIFYNNPINTIYTVHMCGARITLY